MRKSVPALLAFALLIPLLSCFFGCRQSSRKTQPGIHRGYLFPDGEFRPCGSLEPDAWTLDDPRGLLPSIRRQIAGPEVPSVFWELEGRRKGSVLHVDAVRRASLDPHACGEDWGRARLRALAGDSSWSAELLPEGVHFRSADLGTLAFTGLSERREGGMRRIQATGDGRSLTLEISAGDCLDAAYAYSSLRAEARVGDRVFRGCAIENPD
jgi:uncharacterized membrane protein